jgi:hypothetical protein
MALVKKLRVNRLKSFAKSYYLKLKASSLGLFKGKAALDPRMLLPIIIFQPGKVGSSSVHASLLEKYAELGISVPIYHAHVLQNTEARINYITQNRKAPVRSVKKLQESQALREQIKKDPQQGWNVINLVREPVAMKVSALFQVLHEYIPDWEDRFKEGKLSMSELDDIIYHSQEFGTKGLKWWYDNEIKSLWEIDVFDQSFSKEKGYQTYHQGNINLIVIRLEDLNRVAGPAFEEFMGLKGLTITNVNVGENKPYANLYQKFKQRPLPDDYVNSFYETQFALHFYTKQELEQFRQKWTKSSSPQEEISRPQINSDTNIRLLTPVIIFQPGKVGSTSVLKSLRRKYKELGLSTPIYHAHRLEKIDQRIEFITKVRKDPTNTVKKLLESQELREKIDNHPEQAWNIISLVRDPVAQRVSSVFQVINEYIPDWQQQFARGELTLENIQKTLFEGEEFDFHGLDSWFDEQLKPVWGLDVYRLPFDCIQGYHIYRPSSTLNLMIVRLEDLDSVAQQAFYEFIGIENFSIVSTNTGKEKPYRELYGQFKALPLPAEFVEAAYETRYARHFYTDEELQAFRKKWLKL